MIEQTISNLIPNQFPSLYQEEGQVLIAFVKCYYEWLEKESVLKQSRSLVDYWDIDNTEERFLVYFKEKYLKNIQFNTKTNKRLAVKHALELHRSKGSERSIDLFFRLVYGKGARVYYPGDDILRADNNIWFTPYFLEVSNTEEIKNLLGKEITGIESNAKAFVDSAIKKEGRNLLYLTNIRGTFRRGEAIYYGSVKENSPKILGSLLSVEIDDVTGVFTKGEEVTISSATSAETATGIIRNTNLTDLKVIETGTNFRSGQTVNISSFSGATANGSAVLAPLGNDRAFFKNKEGFIDDNKFFFDGTYYQEYSYEVLSPMSFDKYEETLRRALHVAGTKLFGSIEITEKENIGLLIESTVEQYTG